VTNRTAIASSPTAAAQPLVSRIGCRQPRTAAVLSSGRCLARRPQSRVAVAYQARCSSGWSCRAAGALRAASDRASYGTWGYVVLRRCSRASRMRSRPCSKALPVLTGA